MKKDEIPLHITSLEKQILNPFQKYKLLDFEKRQKRYL